jgi:hypothetical protein
VVGRLVAEGVFHPDPPVPPARAAVEVEDVIAVGRSEPRVLELLPALLVRRPGMFVRRSGLTPELAAAVQRLKDGRTPESCFGVSGVKLLRTLDKLGPARDRGSKLKAFRLTADDQELLLGLADSYGLSETDVIRYALRVLAAKEENG